MLKSKWSGALVALVLVTTTLFAANIPARVFYGKYQSNKHLLYIGKGDAENALKLQWYKNGDKELEFIEHIGSGSVRTNVPGSIDKKKYIENQAHIEKDDDSYLLVVQKDYFDGKDKDRLYFEYVKFSLGFEGTLTVHRASGDDESDPHEDILQLKRTK